MILINNEKGKKLLKNIQSKIKIEKYSLNIAIENNPCLTKPTEIKKEREEFFYDLNSKEFNYVVKKYLTSNKIWIFKLYYALPKPIRKFLRKNTKGVKYE